MEKLNLSNNVDLHETRWGYVAYDYVTYRNLRRLHFIYLQALRQAAKWRRWNRKLPHNRILEQGKTREDRRASRKHCQPWPEPEICPLFTSKHVRRVTFDQCGRHHPDGFNETSLEIHDQVATEYKKARKPQPKPIDVSPSRWTPEQVASLLRRAEQWYTSLTK